MDVILLERGLELRSLEGELEVSIYFDVEFTNVVL